MIEKIEKKALLLGFIGNLSLALLGWGMFLYTRMDALFLDAGFSFVAAMSSLLAIFISRQASKKSNSFSTGSHVLAPIYAFFNQLISLTIVVSVSSASIFKLFKFFSSGVGEPVKIDFMLYYSIVVSVISFLLAVMYAKAYKKTNQLSNILDAERKTVLIDGIMSIGIGIAVGVLALVDIDSNLGYFHYIADPVISLFLALFTIKEPVKLLKKNFLEIANALVLDKNITTPILADVKKMLPNYAQLKRCHVRKIGSLFVVDVYFKYAKNLINIGEMNNSKARLEKKLKHQYMHIMINYLPE